MKFTQNKYSVGMIEYLTTGELARKLRVKPSWIIAQARSRDPIPSLKNSDGQTRYSWGSKKLTDWLNRKKEE